MPRIFTVTFAHRGKNYTAVVSQLHGSVSIYLPDESFHHLLPQGRFSYHTEEEIGNDIQMSSSKQQLMRDVLAAIKSQRQPAVE